MPEVKFSGNSNPYFIKETSKNLNHLAGGNAKKIVRTSTPTPRNQEAIEKTAEYKQMTALLTLLQQTDKRDAAKIRSIKRMIQDLQSKLGMIKSTPVDVVTDKKPLVKAAYKNTKANNIRPMRLY